MNRIAFCAAGAGSEVEAAEFGGGGGGLDFSYGRNQEREAEGKNHSELFEGVFDFKVDATGLLGFDDAAHFCGENRNEADCAGKGEGVFIRNVQIFYQCI